MLIQKRMLSYLPLLYHRLRPLPPLVRGFLARLRVGAACDMWHDGGWWEVEIMSRCALEGGADLGSLITRPLVRRVIDDWKATRRLSLQAAAAAAAESAAAGGGKGPSIFGAVRPVCSEEEFAALPRHLKVGQPHATARGGG